MNHNQKVLANEIANLSAKALMHRTLHKDGHTFEWGGTTIRASLRSAVILEKAVANLERELAKSKETYGDAEEA